MEKQREKAVIGRELELEALTAPPAALMTACIACLPNVNHKWSLKRGELRGKSEEESSTGLSPKTLANSQRISSQIYVDIPYWSN